MPRPIPLLFNNLGHDEIAVVDLRCILQDIGGAEAGGDLVLALLHGHISDPRHRLDRAGIDFVELGYPVEDAGKFLLEPALLLLGNREAGETGDAADGGAVSTPSVPSSAMNWSGVWSSTGKVP